MKCKIIDLTKHKDNIERFREARRLVELFPEKYGMWFKFKKVYGSLAWENRTPFQMDWALYYLPDYSEKAVCKISELNELEGSGSYVTTRTRGIGLHEGAFN